MIDSTWQQLHTNKLNLSRRPKGNKLLKKIFLFVILTSSTILFSYVLVNIQAIYKSFKYQIKDNFSPYYHDITNQINLSAQANQNYLQNDNLLIIPKIDLNSSIIWGSSEDSLSSNLKKSVVQLDSTNLPSDLTGNIILIGNSSLPFWQDDGGGTVFTLINKLELGDRITINYQENYFVYQVKSKKTVSGANIELDKSDGNQLLTLMTCYPLGINSQRLLIIAELVSTSLKTKKSDSDNTDSMSNIYLAE